ncbi:MAG TPA: AraC family transcriptional regulator [Planctomycetota bacterium]|nr:AraC family transcriptional regulator [Planctomycetota bacterium]
MGTAAVVLPARFFRKEVAHRGMQGSDSDHMIGAGFLLKPGGAHQHVNSVFGHYSGVLVLRGEGTYVDWQGREHRTFPGCFFQRVAGRRHSTLHPASSDWAECYVNLGRPFAAALSALGSLDLERPVLNPGLSLALVERFDRLVAELRDCPESELPRMLAEIHALVVDVYALDRRGSRQAPAAREIEEAARRLAADPAERISLPRLAEELGLGYERFRKAFAARFGTSPGDYRIRRRVERARSMLAHGDLTVKEVAHQLGYANAFAFSRQFKAVLGAAPSRFRRVP